MQISLLWQRSTTIRDAKKMFSNSNDYNIINPFAHLPSSSNYHPPLPPPPPPPPSSTLPSHDCANDIFFSHHHDLLSASSLLPPNPQLTGSLINMALLNNATMITQDSVGGGVYNGVNCYGASESFSIPVKKRVKKDRHSKISTAQGVRDRRVRLSIEIAREFFDLQDMLGFDKPSKTLEWLLTNSRNAIRELVRMKKHGHGSSGDQRISLTSRPDNPDPDPHWEMVVENDGEELDGTASKSKSLEVEGVVCKEKKMKNSRKAAVPILLKESRAKARARARERTREKMCTSTSTTHDHERKISCPDTSPQFLTQVQSLTQLEASKKPDQFHGHNQKVASSFKVVTHQDQVEEAAGKAPRENVIKESIVIKRKVKPPSTILGYQHNLAPASKEAICCTDGHNYFPNLHPNWDINGKMAHSSLRAISNFNLSTGVQIYGKP